MNSFRQILSDDDLSYLHGLADAYPQERFRGDARNFEEMAVDFVQTSAKIEGNTYDRIDTDNLLRLGVTAGGRRYSDAVMLLNIREAFGRMLAIEQDATLDEWYFSDLHAVAMRDLLPTSSTSGTATRGRPG